MCLTYHYPLAPPLGLVAGRRGLHIINGGRLKWCRTEEGRHLLQICVKQPWTAWLWLEWPSRNLQSWLTAMWNMGRGTVKVSHAAQARISWTLISYYNLFFPWSMWLGIHDDIHGLQVVNASHCTEYFFPPTAACHQLSPFLWLSSLRVCVRCSQPHYRDSGDRARVSGAALHTGPQAGLRQGAELQG